MRRQVLRQVLAALSDNVAVELMGEVCRRGRESAEIEVAILTLAAVLDREDLGYERQAALYEEAKGRGNDLVMRLLLTGGRQPGSSRAQFGDPVVEPTLALGWRKSFARGSRRDMLDRLLNDPDPSVLTILLQNPRVIERDAVRLAARRPTTAAAQRVVFGSRHGAAYRVRQALVSNPFTPVDLSARILPGLPQADITDVARSMELAESLRGAASAILRSRVTRGDDSERQRRGKSP